MNHIESPNIQTSQSINGMKTFLAVAVPRNTGPRVSDAVIAVMTQAVESGQGVTTQRRSTKGEMADLPGRPDCPASGMQRRG
jgi:hypothetical protein